MSYRPTLLAAAAAVAMLLSVPGYAQTQQPPAQPGPDHRHGRLVALLDTDGDGKISAEEIAAEQKRLFTAADVNGDGKLSPYEFRRRGAWFQVLSVVTLFDLLDSNGDAAVTLDEIQNPSKRWFKRYDANNNGKLDDDELAQHGRGMGGPPWRRDRH
jgi:Ca2+-binding EF-hand superfamily protein